MFLNASIIAEPSINYNKKYRARKTAALPLKFHEFVLYYYIDLAGDIMKKPQQPTVPPPGGTVSNR